ncbi:MAG: PEP-CTERM sorting domain-containing protein [Thermoguttaceae bacterium]|jgi:hypothetical protein|nr:PEP-CTERM sorting domain-containing protein [Thermoguttaceae bacterium]
MLARLSLAVLLALPASGLRADLLVYEGFDYPYASNEPLTGKIGGMGFTGAWQAGVHPTTGVSEDSLLINDNGLAYPMLATVGNAAWDNSGGSQANYRAWDSSGYTGTGDVLWFSFLFNTSSVSTSSELRIFALGSDTYSSGAGAMAFTNATPAQEGKGMLHAQLGGSRSGGLLYDHDTDNLVVGRVDFTGNDSAGSVTVWLNPSRNAEPIAADGVTRTGTTSTAAWTNLYARGGSAWRGQLDELRIGTSFFDVVPVPEPASGLLAMLGMVGVLLVRCRRRRC